MPDIAHALESLGFLDEYQGATNGNDEATYRALRWKPGVKPPSWAEVAAIPNPPSDEPEQAKILIREIRAIRDGLPETPAFRELSDKTGLRASGALR